MLYADVVPGIDVDEFIPEGTPPAVASELDRLLDHILPFQKEAAYQAITKEAVTAFSAEAYADQAELALVRDWLPEFLQLLSNQGLQVAGPLGPEHLAALPEATRETILTRAEALQHAAAVLDRAYRQNPVADLWQGPKVILGTLPAILGFRQAAALLAPTSEPVGNPLVPFPFLGIEGEDEAGVAYQYLLSKMANVAKAMSGYFLAAQAEARLAAEGARRDLVLFAHLLLVDATPGFREQGMLGLRAALFLEMLRFLYVLGDLCPTANTRQEPLPTRPATMALFQALSLPNSAYYKTLFERTPLAENSWFWQPSVLVFCLAQLRLAACFRQVQAQLSAEDRQPGAFTARAFVRSTPDAVFGALLSHRVRLPFAESVALVLSRHVLAPDARATLPGGPAELLVLTILDRGEMRLPLLPARDEDGLLVLLAPVARTVCDFLLAACGLAPNDYLAVAGALATAFRSLAGTGAQQMFASLVMLHCRAAGGTTDVELCLPEVADVRPFFGEAADTPVTEPDLFVKFRLRQLAPAAIGLFNEGESNG